MDKLSPKVKGIGVPVDLIRTIAIGLVILLHSAEEPFASTNIISTSVIVRWFSITIYNSLSRPCIPLFVMLTGALLLQPYKVAEPLKVFFKKRLWRIGLPFIFWGGVYYVWSYYADHTVWTLRSISQSILNGGPYYQFWYLYMLLGLYLITPLIRVLVTYASRTVLRYFLLFWFVGVSVVPLIQLVTGYSLDSDVFVIGTYIGYFILGTYLLGTRLNSKMWSAILFGAYAWSVAGTYLATYFIGGTLQYFFLDYFSVNVVIASVALFLLLRAVPDNFADGWFLSIGNFLHFSENFSLKSSTSLNKLLHFISGCTLAIYLMHVIVLESLERGYLGIRISISTINPIIEIPLGAAVTLLICIIILYPVSKNSVLKKIIGIV